MVLTPKGVKPKVGPEVFANVLTAVRCTMESRGLPPAVALQSLRSVAWAKVAHGAVVTLPCAATLTNKWLTAVRQVLCTFKRVHRAELVRELGLLYHPVAWHCRAVIRFYGTALTTARDPVLKRVLSETVGSPSHPLRREIESALTPCGVTWEELASVAVPDLLRKADGRLREWTREQLLGEAERLGLHQGEAAPLWREWSDGPRKYLYEEKARYGFMFRRRVFSPPGLEAVACYFCGRPGGNSGRHVLYCDVARAEFPLPEMLRHLSTESLEQALLLEDSTPKERLQAGLGYMQQLSHAIAMRRRRDPQPNVNRITSSNPHLFKVGRRPAAPPLDSRRRGTKRRAPGAASQGEDETVPVPKRRRQRQADPLLPATLPAEASEENDEVPRDFLALLDEPCHELILPVGERPPADEAPQPERLRKRLLDGSEVSSPPAKRLQLEPSAPAEVPVPLAPAQSPAHSIERDGTWSEEESAVPLAPAQSPAHSIERVGAWSEEESDQLARAVLLIGDRSSMALASLVPTRGRKQIKMRLRTGEHRACVDRISAAKAAGPQLETSDSLVTSEKTPMEAPTAKLQPPTPAMSGPIPSQRTAPKQYNKGRWTKQECALLFAYIRAHGCNVKAETLSRAVGTRSALQCSDRMREQSTHEFIESLSLGTPVQGEPAGISIRWDSPEIRRLEAAINQLGNCMQSAKLAEIIGSRTGHQVAVKVKFLLRAGKLRETAPGCYTIDA